MSKGEAPQTGGENGNRTYLRGGYHPRYADPYERAALAAGLPSGTEAPRE